MEKKKEGTSKYFLKIRTGARSEENRKESKRPNQEERKGGRSGGGKGDLGYLLLCIFEGHPCSSEEKELKGGFSYYLFSPSVACSVEGTVLGWKAESRLSMVKNSGDKLCPQCVSSLCCEDPPKWLPVVSVVRRGPLSVEGFIILKQIFFAPWQSTHSQLVIDM